MSTITVYSFEGPRDNPYTGERRTQDYQEAEAYAAIHHYRVIAHEYEWADSYPMVDYTGDDEADGDAGDSVTEP